MSVSRETLYEEIWAEPMTTVAARYGVASNFLGRICERLRVPCPPRGYWAQLKVGKADPRPSLPPARPGDEVSWARTYGEYRTAQPHLDRTPFPSARTTRSRPDWPHPFVSGLQPEYEKGRVTSDEYLKPAKRTLPDVFVSKDALPRALSTLSDLLWKIEQAGHRVVFAPRDEIYQRPFLNHHGGKNELQSWDVWHVERPTLAFVGGVAFGLTLFEKTESVEVAWRDGKHVRVADLPKRGRWAYPESTSRKDLPSGRLCLRVYSPYPGVEWEKRWEESTAGELSKSFGAVVKEMEAAGPAIVKLAEEATRRREEEQRRWEAERKEAQIQEAARKKAEAEKSSRDQLLGIVQGWSLARQIEAFFVDLERRAEGKDDEARLELQERLSRARNLLGTTDALKHFESWSSPEDLLAYAAKHRYPWERD